MIGALLVGRGGPEPLSDPGADGPATVEVCEQRGGLFGARLRLAGSAGSWLECLRRPLVRSVRASVNRTSSHCDSGRDLCTSH